MNVYLAGRTDRGARPRAPLAKRGRTRHHPPATELTPKLQAMNATTLTRHRAASHPGAALTLATTLLLAACGGGGGGGGGDTGGSEPPAATGCAGGAPARLDVEPLAQHRSSEIHLVSCGGTLTRLRWSSSGPNALPLLTDRAPSVSVLPQLAGTQRFQVSFTDAAGRAHTLSTDLAVAAADLPRNLLTRGDPSAWSGDRLSLRAWPQGYSEAELVGSSVSWARVSGPAVTLADPGSARLLLTAPAVTRDEVLVLRATLSWPDGRSVSDDFRLLVQPVPAAAAAPLFEGSFAASRTVPYLEDGPHAAALQRCVYSPALVDSGANLCTLSELPLLGQTSAVPTVEQVMQRVLVAHDWQAQVFERFLREQDSSGDLRRMLAATTAVVIGGRIRPAFYWSATGAIYLDASYLWLTPEQRDTVSEAPDPRSDFGLDLSYSSPWRYVKDNAFATPARPVAARGTRSLAEIRVELGRLLYHELTHAGDFFPPASHASLPGNLRVYQAVPAQTPSQRLQQQLPFFSSEMVGLGRVLFHGETATSAQRAYTPQDVAALFAADRVNDDYSYSMPVGATVPREDTAMLVEEAMVQLRYGVLRDFGFTARILPGSSAADQVLVWGQRGRIGDAALRPRLQLVLSEIMPWVTAAELAQLAAPLPLRAGLTWGQNLDQSAVGANQPRALRADEREREREQATQWRWR